jgi:hypothetical protein
MALLDYAEERDHRRVREEPLQAQYNDGCADHPSPNIALILWDWRTPVSFPGGSSLEVDALAVHLYRLTGSHRMAGDPANLNGMVKSSI